MLTTQDINQIKSVVQSEVNPIKGDVHSIKLDIGVLRDDVVGLKKDIKLIKKDLRKVKSDLDVTINLFDRDIIRNRKHLDRIEAHLHLPAAADF